MKIMTLLATSLLFGLLLKSDYQVKVAGAMRQIMQQGDLSAKAALDTLLAQPHLYALGPVEGLVGEIMVLDGVPYTCAVAGKTLSLRQSPEEKAAMLVYTHVDRWQTLRLAEGVNSYQALEKMIQARAKAAGIDTEKPFPFLLTGTATRVNYHVIDWQPGTTHTMQNHKQFARTGELKGAVQVLGFYSTRHHGVFTHHSTNMHLHVMDAGHTLEAVLDRIKKRVGLSWSYQATKTCTKRIAN